MIESEIVKLFLKHLTDSFYFFNPKRPSYILNVNIKDNNYAEVEGFMIMDSVVFYVKGIYNDEKKSAIISIGHNEEKIVKVIKY